MLTPTKVSLGDLDITIIPTMILYMIDRKVYNAVSSCFSAQCWNISKAKPTEMNNINEGCEGKTGGECQLLKIF